MRTRRIEGITLSPTDNRLIITFFRRDSIGKYVVAHAYTCYWQDEKSLRFINKSISALNTLFIGYRDKKLARRDIMT